MRRILALSLVLLAATAATAALANDGSFELAAGGLVLTQNHSVEMVSEDLYVSTREVHVRYVFRNRTGRDVSTIVGFPLPDRTLPEFDADATEWPTGFSTRVDGRPVALQVERRAMVGDVDHAALLTGLGVPLVEGGGGVEAALAALAPADRERLVALGVARRPELVPDAVMPAWTVRETWYWQQLFPAGRDVVVEHSYRPATGGTVVAQLADPEHWDSDSVRAAVRRHCVDRRFLDAVRRGAARAGHGSAFDELRVGYILRTGASWRAPIRDFRLVVDKGDPRNLLSFCGEGVRRLDASRFEIRRRNWRPDRDLDILIMRPLFAGD